MMSVYRTAGELLGEILKVLAVKKTAEQGSDCNSCAYDSGYSHSDMCRFDIVAREAFTAPGTNSLLVIVPDLKLV